MACCKGKQPVNLYQRSLFKGLNQNYVIPWYHYCVHWILCSIIWCPKISLSFQQVLNLSNTQFSDTDFRPCTWRSEISGHGWGDPATCILSKLIHPEAREAGQTLLRDGAQKWLIFGTRLYPSNWGHVFFWPYSVKVSMHSIQISAVHRCLFSSVCVFKNGRPMGSFTQRTTK